MAKEAFENATAQPGLFIGPHSKEIAQIYECYAEILKDEGKLDLSRIQENKAKFIRKNPPHMNSTHSTDTRYCLARITRSRFRFGTNWTSLIGRSLI